MRSLNIISLFSILLFIYPFNSVKSQELTTVRGIITDSVTNDPLPFVNIIFQGKNIGTTTDFDGKFSLSTKWASSTIKVSFVGYDPIVKKITIGKSQYLEIKLRPHNIDLKEVVIKTESKRYRNKDNPAVELIRKVIDNKKRNRGEAAKYYEYKRYEKLEMSLNNFGNKFFDKPILRKLKFVLEYVDTSKVNGKPYLPFYLKESLSRVYYKQDGDIKREFVDGQRVVGLEKYIDQDGANSINKSMYTDIDIYDNDIFFMTNQFVSPTSVIAPTFYKFFIIDTVMVDNRKCINLGFIPRNKISMGFTGNLYITDDTLYVIKRVDMGVCKDISLNFVNDVKIEQDFSLTKEGFWALNKDEMTIDYSLSKKGLGMFAHKTVTYNDRMYNLERPDSNYRGVQKSIVAENASQQPMTYWNSNRPIPLSHSEKGVEEMMIRVQNVPAFKRFMNIVMLIFAGYEEVGPIDIGPVNTFYSFNEVEGLRLRVGGKTNLKFSDRVMLEGFYAYGTKDEKSKYLGAITYSFRNIKTMFNEFPSNNIKFTYQHDTKIPGQELKFFAEDNFLLSFKRGISDKMTYNDLYKLEYNQELTKGISYGMSFKYLEQSPGGNWKWNYRDNESNKVYKDKITTNEIGINFRFAPNEQFYQGKTYRIPIYNQYPIIQLRGNFGLKNLMNGEYNYQCLNVNIFKRFYMSILGYSDLELDGGRIWGNVPYPLLFVHNANQTYAYQIQAYNMMNFLEFVSDKYASMNYTHYFNGLFLNRIPLFKRLKFRELVSVKALFGEVGDNNNPYKNHDLLAYPTDANGNPLTFTLDGKPYVEASVGVSNILKFLRVDLVKRMTYMENPNVPSWGIRARFKFDF
ncbi:MAG: carboxypeptidase-like regulatory domain-containing protein [Bacteroidetes bacterium]|nr:carboxypeptidase-like regulatory domain-containing protein [Bacteroidota bacterium]